MYFSYGFPLIESNAKDNFWLFYWFFVKKKTYYDLTEAANKSVCVCVGGVSKTKLLRKTKLKIIQILRTINLLDIFFLFKKNIYLLLNYIYFKLIRFHLEKPQSLIILLKLKLSSTFLNSLNLYYLRKKYMYTFAKQFIFKTVHNYFSTGHVRLDLRCIFLHQTTFTLPDVFMCLMVFWGAMKKLQFLAGIVAWLYLCFDSIF